MDCLPQCKVGGGRVGGSWGGGRGRGVVSWFDWWVGLLVSFSVTRTEGGERGRSSGCTVYQDCCIARFSHSPAIHLTLLKIGIRFEISLIEKPAP